MEDSRKAERRVGLRGLLKCRICTQDVIKRGRMAQMRLCRNGGQWWRYDEWRRWNLGSDSMTEYRNARENEGSVEKKRQRETAMM